MSQALTREIRPLLPIVAVTLLITAVAKMPHWQEGSAVVISAILVAACWCIMGASVFGREFSERTMTLLLSQPVSRRQIWWQKMAVLGAGMLSVLALLILCQRILLPGDKHGALPFLVVLAVCAYCSTPYLALLTRQTVGAVVFAFIFPMLVMLVVHVLASHFPWLWLKDVESVNYPELFRNPVGRWTTYLLLLYSGVCFWLGYRKFIGLQVVDSQSLDLDFPRRLEAGFGRWSSGRHGPLVCLVLKELLVQRVTLLTALVFCAIVLVEFAVKAVYTGMDGIYLVSTVVIYVVMLPIVSGAASVAEEREWGTAHWQLTLPVSTRRQWAVKCAVTLSLVFLLGIILPTVARLLSPFNDFRLMRAELPDLYSAVWIVLLYLLFTSVVMYASSLTTNTLRAVLTGMVSIASIAGVITLGTKLGDVYDSFPFNLLAPVVEGPMVEFPYFWLVDLSVVLCLVLVVAWRNYRTIEPRQNWLVVQWVLLLSGFFFLACAMAYPANRIPAPDPHSLGMRARPNVPGIRGGANYRRVQPGMRGQLQPGLPKKEDQ